MRYKDFKTSVMSRHQKQCGGYLASHFLKSNLPLWLPKEQQIRFRETEDPGDVVERERHKKTMLTAFFHWHDINRNAPKHLYKDFPKHFTWNASTNRWNPQQRTNSSMRGRLVSANPAEGDRYYLRLLLSHVSGPTSFDDLYTANGVLHTTFRKSALSLELIETDNNLSDCLAEASLFQIPYGALRRLFATILIFCEPGDVRNLWDDHYESFLEDHRQLCHNDERVKNMVLTDIKVFLQSMGENLEDFDLPRLTLDVNLKSGAAYDEIISRVDNNLPGVFFIDGPDGTGKTFLYNALLAEVRSRVLIALASAISGVAANNMPGGTAHSRFKIPLNLNNNSMCNIKQLSGTAELLRDAKKIIWDEASMAKRQA
uniref:uncharacterized protein LOC122583223 n=1 Tax=Erigeron canadensis TaxID=72917 RepID=UPI001CB9C23D|nr:uncharacterized protein LOC122583223 [Erigeron canadensis]